MDIVDLSGVRIHFNEQAIEWLWPQSDVCTIRASSRECDCEEESSRGVLVERVEVMAQGPEGRVGTAAKIPSWVIAVSLVGISSIEDCSIDDGRLR